MSKSLLANEETLTIQSAFASEHASLLSLEELLPLLASPDSQKALQLIDGGEALNDGELRYPLQERLPLLYPTALHPFYGDKLILPMELFSDPFLQYFQLSYIKQSGEGINAAYDNVHYQRHLFRMKEFLSQCQGVVLDVGCDHIPISQSLFPSSCQYVGLDPFAQNKEHFRLIGVGERLPFQNASVDHVCFNTSLDHILDYQQALDEAKRVLKPGGTLCLATLIWTKQAHLLGDHVHFHHFRDHAILGPLEGMTVLQEKRYGYKGEKHRHGLYLEVQKPLTPTLEVQ